MKSLHHGAIERLKRDMDSISRAGWPSVHRRLQAEHYLTNAIISRLVTHLEQSKSQQLHDRIIEGASACHSICPEIGRAHVGTPVTNAHMVCRLPLAQTTVTRCLCFRAVADILPAKRT